MRRSDRIWLAVTVAITMLAAWIVRPTNPGIHFVVGDSEVNVDFRTVLGLDLQGGLQVLLEADPPAGQSLNQDSMRAARSIIEQRVNGFGTTEPVIQIQGNNRIVVELPGVKSAEERERAVRLFGETGLLEFMDMGSTPLPPGSQVQEGQFPTILTGKNLDPKAVAVSFDERNRPQINFGWDAEGARVFGDYTEKHIGQYLAIVLDKVVLSAPQIQSRIDQNGRITGSFAIQEARDIVTKLKYGALPVPMKVIQQREVGATLGEDSVRKSVVAGAVGLGVVMAFMLIYYRLPGLLANAALLIYSLLTFSLFKNPWMPITLTLAGIAGFILSIGMAVDANILIFERTKEELRGGRRITAAVDAGFSRAMSSIIPSNVSTWITCAILYVFGTGMIRGFALTLALGVAVSMFTAITVSHTFMRLAILTPAARYPWLFGVSNLPAPPAVGARASRSTPQAAGA